MGKNSINMRRVTTKVHELFDGEIDMSDFRMIHLTTLKQGLWQLSL